MPLIYSIVIKCSFYMQKRQKKIFCWLKLQTFNFIIFSFIKLFKSYKNNFFCTVHMSCKLYKTKKKTRIYQKKFFLLPNNNF